jgi:hypothetical protein
MKPSSKKIKILLIFLLVLVIITLSGLTKEKSRKAENTLIQLSKTENQETTYYNEMAEKLIECESSNRPLTINPKDRDGTASYSYAQWKPETFKIFGVKYGILGEKADWNYIMTIIWNREINKYLVVKILENEDMATIKRLWGNCIRKIGFRKL